MQSVLSAFRRASSVSAGGGIGGIGGGGGASSTTAGLDPPSSLGTVRIAVVGPPSCGKSALVALLCRAAGAPPPSSTAQARAAAGTNPAAAAAAAAAAANAAGSAAFATCAVTVALADVAVPGLDDEHGGGKLQGDGESPLPPPRRRFFVEIFDVSAQASLCELRRLFYAGLNGVVLAYDLSSCDHHNASAGGGVGLVSPAALRQVAPWASEVAAEGSFVAPLPPAVAERCCLGGLPVPVLLAGCKLDRQRRRMQRWRRWGGRGGSGGGGGGGGGGVTGMLRALLARLLLLLTLPLVLFRRRQRPQSAAGLLPVAREEEAAVPASPPQPTPTQGTVSWSIATSAATGEVEPRDALCAYLALLWARRYAPSSALALAADAAGSADAAGAKDAAAVASPRQQHQLLPPPPPVAASAAVYDPYAPAPQYSGGGGGGGGGWARHAHG
jgi:GTPase SAR1 family protein